MVAYECSIRPNTVKSKNVSNANISIEEGFNILGINKENNDREVDFSFNLGGFKIYSALEQCNIICNSSSLNPEKSHAKLG